MGVVTSLVDNHTAIVTGLPNSIRILRGKEAIKGDIFWEDIAASKGAYYAGKMAGDAASVLAGIIEAFFGMGGGAGGFALAPATGGVSLGVSAAGIVLTVEGISVAVNGVRDLSTSAERLSVEISKSQGSSEGDNEAKSIDDILDGAKETTNNAGIARNFEKTGGYEKNLEDFNALQPSNVKDIQTQYGSGKVGYLEDGTTVVARPGSKTGGATLEIKISNKKIYKIRY